MKIRFDLYSPQELRDEIDYEIKRCGDATQAAYNAIFKLNKIYGALEKARGLKEFLEKAKKMQKSSDAVQRPPRTNVRNEILPDIKMADRVAYLKDDAISREDRDNSRYKKVVPKTKNKSSEKLEKTRKFSTIKSIYVRDTSGNY